MLSGCCVLLLTFVATRWHPLLGLTGDVSRAKHRRAVREHGLTQVFRVPTDWVRDPRAMRLVCAAAAVRRHCD
ncbi:hypothetical protein FB157_10779 [Streptomyces sp. BK340]|nr:hypothetical protein FB157_10779 [Streptomyces sp. BK340]